MSPRTSPPAGPALAAPALLLLAVAASCADCDRIPCKVDADCGAGGACAAGFCRAAGEGEGEGEGSPGEGEPGEGEGSPGEGEGSPGEGEGSPGEGEGSPGEGEGSPGEGEGEGAPTTQPPVVTNLSVLPIGVASVQIAGTATDDVAVLTIDIDWGDGSPHTALSPDAASVDLSLTPGHLYAVPANGKTITVTAGDGEQTSSASVVVSGVPNDALLHADFNTAPLPTGCLFGVDPSQESDRAGHPGGVCFLKDIDSTGHIAIDLASNVATPNGITIAGWMNVSFPPSGGSPLACFGEQGRFMIGFTQDPSDDLAAFLIDPATPGSFAPVVDDTGLSESAVQAGTWFFFAATLTKNGDGTSDILLAHAAVDAGSLTVSPNSGTVGFQYVDANCPITIGGIDTNAPCSVNNTIPHCDASYDDVRVFGRPLSVPELEILRQEQP